ncbi:aspartate aminotransferase family protein [Enterovirga rhinocerotis]|uniref:Acetylornithine aminotransferase n=1 Tax=Enterovirga rhinocerotis TaxID=1339210 RepID=A0A4R7BQ04_9HYPH|nr:aspartate aminotransferase family protein [Enterovirga rhinocerotis]TDR87223.1 acetylornithine/N-succinyldiaminopimelate aminotransferase [Enterovirga rhinocerotis]
MTSSLLPVYARAPLTFEKGEGAWLVATDGRRYLDFGSGIAVNALGHAHPQLMAALHDQAAKVWHISNLYQNPVAEALAKKLTDATFADLVFFTNSGAEALEASIKMARKYQAVNGRPERNRIVTFEGAFHGRTLATIAAGGQRKYMEGFGPDMPGFDQVPFGDEAALKAAIGPETAAILLEPVQGEGGIRPVPPETLRRIRQLCDENGLLLILDEVQTGVGRTGKLFAHEWAGIQPDIMAIAKGIGGGFPLGACLATAEAGKGMVPGTHGSTFGGNPLAAAVGNAVMDVVTGEGFLERIQQVALLLKQRLAEIKDRHPAVIAELRGEGLMVGLKLHAPNGELVRAAQEEGLLLIAAGDNVVRLLPPLVITDEDVAEAVGRLDRACATMEAGMKPAMRGAA